MTTQEIAVRHNDPMPLNLTETLTLGKVLAESGFFKDARSAAQAVAKILAGRELGFGPMASMTGVHIIEGKPSISAALMAAAVKGSGKYDYRVREWTEGACSIEFFQHGESIGISTFTMADAKKANLDGKAVWKQYPRNMLFARAMSNGASAYCADVLGGGPVYTPEELGVEVNADGAPIDLTAYAVELPPETTPPATQADASEGLGTCPDGHRYREGKYGVQCSGKNPDGTWHNYKRPEPSKSGRYDAPAGVYEASAVAGQTVGPMTQATAANAPEDVLVRGIVRGSVPHDMPSAFMVVAVSATEEVTVMYSPEVQPDLWDSCTTGVKVDMAATPYHDGSLIAVRINRVIPPNVQQAEPVQAALE